MDLLGEVPAFQVNLLSLWRSLIERFSVSLSLRQRVERRHEIPQALSLPERQAHSRHIGVLHSDEFAASWMSEDGMNASSCAIVSAPYVISLRARTHRFFQGRKERC